MITGIPQGRSIKVTKGPDAGRCLDLADGQTPPRKHQLAIPELFQDVVFLTLAKRPEDRPNSAADRLQTLERTARFQGIVL